MDIVIMVKPNTETVKVMVRVRPMSDNEIRGGKLLYSLLTITLFRSQKLHGRRTSPATSQYNSWGQWISNSKDIYLWCSLRHWFLTNKCLWWMRFSTRWICSRRLQWDNLCLWLNRVREDSHYDGRSLRQRNERHYSFCLCPYFRSDWIGRDR